MLEIIIVDDAGIKATVTGATYWYMPDQMMWGLRNETTGATLRLEGVVSEKQLQYEAEEPEIDFSSSNDVPTLSPLGKVKEVVRIRMPVLPVDILMKLFDVAIEAPKYDVGSPLPTASKQKDNEDLVNELAKLIPGMSQAVAHPDPQCDRYRSTQVESMVIHLNDDHEWTYQQIAEWLDTLDVDLSVQEPSEEEKALDAAVKASDLAALSSDFKDLGYIEEDQLDAAVSSPNAFKKGKTIGTTEGMGCFSVDFTNSKGDLLATYYTNGPIIGTAT